MVVADCEVVDEGACWGQVTESLLPVACGPSCAKSARLLTEHTQHRPVLYPRRCINLDCANSYFSSMPRG